MYPTEMTTSPNIPIPKCRRRYNYSSSPFSCSPIVEAGLVPPSSLVKGYAHLCFSEDGAWFEGHLTTTDDESQYGMIGNRPDVGLVPPPPSDSPAGSSSANSVDSITANLPANPFVSYDVTVIDHNDEQTYVFPTVILTSCQPLCALLSSRFNFNAEQAYRGQKADMLIQRYLTPRLVGNGLKVYAGQVTLDLMEKSSDETVHKTGNPLWCW